MNDQEMHKISFPDLNNRVFQFAFEQDILLSGNSFMMQS